MTTIAGLPFFPLSLDRNGAVTGGAPGPLPPGTTDLIVISHGWKNDSDDATGLYTRLLTNVVAAAGHSLAKPGQSFAVIGIYWPSFRFNPDLSVLQQTAETVAVDVGDGGGTMPPERLRAFARQVADEISDGPDGSSTLDRDAFADLAVKAATNESAADELLGELRAALATPADDDWRFEDAALLERRGRDVVRDIDEGALDRLRLSNDAGATGPAAGLGTIGGRLRDWYRGGRARVAWVLNQATYFEMKARAGHVGKAVATLLDEQPLDGIRLHLIGHSFGARLVSATCANLRQHRAQSLTLLQGAFSHNGFSARVGDGNLRGAFADVIEGQRVDGPILVTHTHNDRAVHVLYAIASSVTGDIAAGFGDRDDPHGGIGANGAQGRDLRDRIVEVRAELGGVPMALDPGKITNLLADTIVADHSAVDNPDVAAWVWQSLRQRSTQPD